MRFKFVSFRLLFLFILLFFIALFIYLENGNTYFSRSKITRGDDLNWRRSLPVVPTKDHQYQIQEQLAKKYCSSCHEYVPPDMLDRITWPRVLTIMRQEINQQGLLFKEEEWREIQQFYLNNSPKVFNSTGRKNTPNLQQQFEGVAVKDSPTLINKYTLLKYLKADSTLYLGRENGEILSLEEDQLKSKFSISNIPVDIDYSNNTPLVLGIGSLAPSEAKKGQLIKIHSKDSTAIIIDSLHRPIHFQITKVKGDTGYLIASFGSKHGTSGGVSFFKSNSSEELLLESLSGAIQSEIADIDQDGKLETVLLFSQANETINIYENLDNGAFNLQKRLPFSPVFGTNSFQLSDFNNDGFLDIIVTNGDNDDYSQIFKPYHGVRIYKNDQLNNFNLAYFYQINGASKVKAADMDADGDVDFVVLAMYSDLFSRPWETLLYFENIGKLNFKVQYFEAKPSAKWMLLELADIDGDNDLDIIIAANDEVVGMIPPELHRVWSKDKIGVKLYYNTTNRLVD